MAFFQIQANSIRRIDDKVAMQIKFKSDDSSKLTANWQYWECESIDEDEIQQSLQVAADEWEKRPDYDATVPPVPTNQWTKVPLDS